MKKARMALVMLSVTATMMCFGEQASALGQPKVTQIPDFSAYVDVVEKKKAFFNFMRPIIAQENEKIAADRAQMLKLHDTLKNGATLSDSESEWLSALAENYQVSMDELMVAKAADAKSWNMLERCVDVVPFRLALAQSANESSWGTSRFAHQGLNMFGQWCFSKGCGIVPKQRDSGKTHEVAKYASVNDSVAAYLLSLNRVPMYASLRGIRHGMRKNGAKPAATPLAEGLLGYSERGQAYVKEIQAMIRVNLSLMGE